MLATSFNKILFCAEQLVAWGGLVSVAIFLPTPKYKGTKIATIKSVSKCLLTSHKLEPSLTISLFAGSGPTTSNPQTPTWQ